VAVGDGKHFGGVRSNFRKKWALRVHESHFGTARGWQQWLYAIGWEAL
jgi:hypothetical protein